MEPDLPEVLDDLVDADPVVILADTTCKSEAKAIADVLSRAGVALSVANISALGLAGLSLVSDVLPQGGPVVYVNGRPAFDPAMFEELRASGGLSAVLTDLGVAHDPAALR